MQRSNGKPNLMQRQACRWNRYNFRIRTWQIMNGRAKYREMYRRNRQKIMTQAHATEA